MDLALCMLHCHSEIGKVVKNSSIPLYTDILSIYLSPPSRCKDARMNLSVELSGMTGHN